jgi:preprotein translocase subunit SecE
LAKHKVQKSSRKGSGKDRPDSSGSSGSGFFSSVKWMLVLILGILAVLGNLHYNYYPFPERLVVLIVIGLVMFGLALSTNSGRIFGRFVMDARAEMRKVVWPSRQEMTQMTVIVIIVIALTALILWAVDGLFSYVIKSLIM